jgi:hypothetical protein
LVPSPSAVSSGLPFDAMIADWHEDNPAAGNSLPPDERERIEDYLQMPDTARMANPPASATRGAGRQLMNWPLVTVAT